MCLQMTYMWLVAVAGLCKSLSSAASLSGGVEVSVSSPVSVHRSHTTTLPCSFNLPQSAENLEIRWYRGDDFDFPIILYQAGKIEPPWEASYEGRVSLVLNDPASGGLKAGDASLKLTNVTISDEGGYTCYVSSDRGYDRGSISLSVIERGTSPSLSVTWKEVNMVNVSCESAGWYPQPRLRWSDQERDLDPKGLTYHNDASGLVSVHSWVLGPGSSEFSCSVGPSDGEEKVAKVHLGKSFQPAAQESGSSAAGWVAFALLLTAVAVLAFLGWLYFKKKVEFFGKKDQVDGTPLTEPLLNKTDTTALTEAKKYFENVTLDEVEHEYIFIKGCKMRDKQDAPFPDGENLSYLTTIKGKTGFSSGKHYWEVSLYIANVGLKESWWLGVTSETVFPLQYNSPLTTSNGFWFLSSSPDTANSLQFNTDPKVFIPIQSRPKTVGVYLDYDSGELFFYNVDDKSVIGSLTASFTREVFPFFNTGRHDKAPMEILQKPVQHL
ncbi:hypothetical protein Q5P01_002710 [Channa striata]|uniref:Butyrophilin subfamily 1 member A1-like n=1 Tax=Channa striata TaxID=64152 RepID=A0AA88T514_CHASR|nr:hypothetical protein Q5P01_002710 [Channa striata]